MARYVKLTIVYDMDDTEKALDDELQDWVDGNITVGDLESHTYELVELPTAEAEKWLGVRP